MHQSIQDVLQQMGLDDTLPPNSTAWPEFLTRLSARLADETNTTAVVSLPVPRSEIKQWLNVLPWGAGLVTKEGKLNWLNQVGRDNLYKKEVYQNLNTAVVFKRPIFHILHFRNPKLNQMTSPAIWEQLRGGRPFDMPTGELVCDNGDLLPASYTLIPLGQGANFQGCLFFFRDISAQKATAKKLLDAKEEAEAASRAKSTFLANMSHELRTPLAAIIGYSELLHEQASLLGYDRFVDRLKKIHVSADHLLALINDILDLSKVEAGRMSLDNDLFTVRTLLDDVAVTVQPLMVHNENRLVTNFGKELGHFYGDQVKVRQILLNLLSNAAKFTTQGEVTLTAVREPLPNSQFSLSALAPQEQLRFVIADTGIGMTDEQMIHLFEPFTQADASTTREFGGTGLGLAISQRFCELMDGKIDLTSDYGQGTTFTLTLPVPAFKQGQIVWPEVFPHPSTSVNKGGQPLVRQRILVVDDDRIIRELLARYLVRQGFEVWLAENGFKALDILAEMKPDAIILDIFMPGLDGWGVLARLKQNPNLAEVPVILATVDDDQRHGFALEADDYLLKPFDYSLLERTLGRHMKRLERGHILLLDDSQHIREILRDQLALQGYRVTEAGNGREGLAVMREINPPDLILLDLMMPEMDGFEFLLELRDNPLWQHVPVIVISVMDLSSADRQRLNGEVERIMQKGKFSRDDLVGQIHQLIHARLNTAV